MTELQMERSDLIALSHHGDMNDYIAAVPFAPPNGRNNDLLLRKRHSRE